jgi:hypothetical protein
MSSRCSRPAGCSSSELRRSASLLIFLVSHHEHKHLKFGSS